MIRRLAFLLWLAGLLTAQPALAEIPAPFRACEVADPANRSPVSLVHFARFDGQAYFQAAGATTVIREGKDAVNAYVVRRSDRHSWELWIDVADDLLWSKYPLAIWDKSSPLVPIAEVELNGNHQVIRLEIDSLLGRAHGRSLMHLAIGSPEAMQAKRKLKTFDITLDIDRLLSTVGWAQHLAGGIDVARCRPLAKAVDDIVNPNVYTACSGDTIVDNVRIASAETFEGPGIRLSWGNRVSPSLFVQVSGSISPEEQTRIKALPLKVRPRAVLGMVTKYFSFSQFVDGNSYATDANDYASYTIRFESGGNVMEAPLLQINRLTHSEQGLDMLLGPAPITVTLFGPKMAPSQTEHLPAGLFRDGATAMFSAWDRLEKLRDDPLSNCTIPAMLVIT